MSALTKEEQDWLKEIKEIAPSCVNGFHIEKCTAIINRLVARCEELEKDKASNFSRHVAELITKDAAITDYNQQIERLEKNLTSLLEAVELVLTDAGLEKYDKMLEKMGRPADVTVDSPYYTYVRFHLVRNLNSVVQKIKEGK